MQPEPFEWAVAADDGRVMMICSSEDEAWELGGDIPGLDIVTVRKVVETWQPLATSQSS